MIYEKWSNDDIKNLIKLYPNNKNVDIAKELNRTFKQVSSKAATLKLKKSTTHISENMARRNKMVGRDLTYDKLKEIALNYKSRGEFQRLDNSAYTTARIAGYLDDICSHMISHSYSIPQLTLYCILNALFKDDVINYNDINIDFN